MYAPLRKLFLFRPASNITVPVSCVHRDECEFCLCIPLRLILEMGIYIWGHWGGSGWDGRAGGWREGGREGGNGCKYSFWSESGPLGFHGLTGKQVSSRDWMGSSWTMGIMFYSLIALTIFTCLQYCPKLSPKLYVKELRATRVTFLFVVLEHSGVVTSFIICSAQLYDNKPLYLQDSLFVSGRWG